MLDDVLRMKFNRDFEQGVTLEDGSHVRVRLLGPDDKHGLAEAITRLSPTTYYQRFFTGPKPPSEEMLNYLTHTDNQNHLALLALEESPDLKSERGVGVARFIRAEDDPHVAEAAVTVIDTKQGLGLGRALLTLLAEAARERGIERFRGEVLASNDRMRHILEETGARVGRTDDATLTFEVPLRPPEEHTDLSLRNLLRLLTHALLRWVTPAEP